MNKEFNYKLVLKILGSLLLVESIFILTSAIVSSIYNENDWHYFVKTSLIAIVSGSIFILIGKDAKKTIGRREGSLIVTLIWIVFSFIGMLPFWLSGAIPSFTNAFFETISGFTTTGASILNDIESLSHGMLYWRSLTHWIGGLGIIVISLALLPMFGFSGIQLFGAESSGPTKDKIHPKITGTAKRLWYIYMGLTFSETVLLKIGGMNWFDAVCHSFGTIATGGFSTKQASIAYWDSPFIQYVIAIFMVLAGINFSLYYFGLKRRFDKVSKNEELKFYLSMTTIFTLVIFISNIDFSLDFNLRGIEHNFRESLFQVSSIYTSTGYATADYMNYHPFTWFVFLTLMIIGASAGSTCGGIKSVRILLVLKYCYYEFKRIIHPKAVIPISYSGQTVKQEIATKTLAFTLLFLVSIAIGVVVLGISGMNFTESIGGMVSCIGCVGPGLGAVGPAGNYANIPEFSKWFLSFVMLLGRLEMFTVLVLFMPVFWRK